MPARSHLQERQSERSRLQNQLRSSRDLMLQGQDTQSTVDKIAESLTEFEDNRLPSRNQGRMSLYDELNQLIRKNGLRNTSGPSLPLLNPLIRRNAAPSRSRRCEVAECLSRDCCHRTVEGSYQNLRALFAVLRQAKSIIINAIEWNERRKQNCRGRFRHRGPQVVEFRLDMATTFRCQG